MQCQGQRQLGVEILRSKILLRTLYTADDSCHKRSESKEAFQGRGGCVHDERTVLGELLRM